MITKSPSAVGSASDTVLRVEGSVEPPSDPDVTQILEESAAGVIARLEGATDVERELTAVGETAFEMIQRRHPDLPAEKIQGHVARFLSEIKDSIRRLVSATAML